MTHLIPGPQPMHCADLVRGERLSEQVDCGHLTAEHSLLVKFCGCTDVTLVERLLKSQHVFIFKA